jgi:diguanylate cyclase (GGDEF)-like protein/PAS domain S-box-containing protein
MKSRIPILISNVKTDLKIDPQLHELDVETAVWIPVLGSNSNKPRGVLILARCRPVPFTHDDVNLLTTMAYRIGLSLEQAQHSIQIESVEQASRKINRHLNQSAICSEVTRRFPPIMGANASVLVLMAEDGECSITQTGLNFAQNDAWSDLTRRYFKGGFLTGREPLYIPVGNLMEDPFIGKMLHLCQVQTLLAIPILIENEIKGILFAIRFSKIPFDTDTLKIALLYAGQTSAALENARLYQTAREELAERQRAEQALRARDERFSAMIRSVSDVIAILNSEGTISYASPAVEQAWGCSIESLTGYSIFNQVHTEDRSTLQQLLSDVQVQPGITLTDFVRFRQNADDWRVFEVIMTNLLDVPAVGGIVSTYHDITERKKYEQKLTNLAYRDALTGLANRTFFIMKLREALKLADSVHESVALIFLDLDNFKIVNDSLGHEIGDEVLKIVAGRISGCLRKDDIAARLGGDEFTVLIENGKTMDQIFTIADRILVAFRDPIWLMNRELYVSSSMGIAFSSPSVDDPENLLRKADLAMYKAKDNGKGCYAVFDMHMNEKAIERLELETELRWALQRKEFRVYYQPIISLIEHQIVGVEALIRWEHPYRGLVSPADIIPLAEETGLIIEIGQWILQEACQQVFAWKKEYSGISSISLSVNLSARQFHYASLVSDIYQVIFDSGLPPSSLILEITESSLIQHLEITTSKLHALKDIGVRLAIDDFGTGYASLNYLRQFPVDILKIDRSFVQGIVSDARDKAIVKSIVDLASAFNLEVTGEGIETGEQAAQLVALGCKEAQGYLFSPPLSAEAFESYIKSTDKVQGYV